MKGSRAGHILVVDDDEGLREALADLLGDEGYDVGLAADGKQALEICHSGQMSSPSSNGSAGQPRPRDSN